MMLVVLATTAAALLWHRLAVARRLSAEQQLMLIRCERAIADRESALEAAQTRLRAAEGELRDADWRNEQSLSVVAHELRAPLAPICIAVALLKRDGISADVRAEAHQVIDRQMARMVKAIDNLLGVGSPVKARTQVASSVADGREPVPAGSAVKTAIVEPRRVMVVDDDQDNTRALAMLLRDRGYVVETTSDSDAALAAADRFRPDVMLLDLEMPKQSGHTLCRSIRRQPWGQGVRMVAQTALGRPDDRRRSESAGFDAYLVKPVDVAMLEAFLRP